MEKFSFLQIRPEACAGLVRWVHKKYNPKAIIITENGLSVPGTMEDDLRISFYTVRQQKLNVKWYINIAEFQRYLSQIRAVLDEGIKLIGYTAWALMDTFEWRDGYTYVF